MFGKLKTFTGLKKPKQTVLLYREPLLDHLKPLFPYTKNAPCRTTRPSCISFYSETSACPEALPLLIDLNTAGSQRGGRAGTHWTWQPTWTECLPTPHTSLMVKCDRYVFSWRPHPISIKSMGIFLPASMNVTSALGKVPILNSLFGHVFHMHSKGLCFNNIPSGQIHCFTQQLINILMVIQVMLANKKKKPENLH